MGRKFKMKSKKGQENIDPLQAIFGIIILFIFSIFVVSIFSSVTNTITKDQCKPFQEQAEQCKNNLNSCLIELNQTKSLLEQCRNDYIELENSTITKKDFEEVKGYFNLTQNEINTINEKIDSIDRVYNFYTIKNYSFALNFVLAIEVLSLLFWKNEFVLVIINWFKNKKKKKETKKESKSEEIDNGN